MSRSKRDILDTERMLERLSDTLYKHRFHKPKQRGAILILGAPASCRAEAEALRRISMTLHNWHELECGTDRGAIERDEKTGKPFWHSAYTECVATARRYVPDREAGAIKRLKAIMARYPTLDYYIQDDPRGCALYILRPGDIPKGESADTYYSRGLAVFK